jgi:excisionase family DNA binding protein
VSQTPLTASELASLLRCSPRTVHAMACQGRIPFLAVGQRRLYEPERVLDALRREALSTAVSGLGGTVQRKERGRIEAMHR